MRVLESVCDLKKALPQNSLGFVATMGALHEGHGTLVKKSALENQCTCVSLFVNPTQFNNPEDYKKYPDRFEEDLALCRGWGVDFIFKPQASEMYQKFEPIKLIENEITQNYEGLYRPGHFSGVLSVVLKLLNLIKPTKAYFGEKDYQQYLIIQKMREQFFLDSKIVPVETYRDSEGLAFSSRNYNLSEEGLKKAQKIAKDFLESKSKKEFLEKTQNKIELEYYGEEWGRALIAHYIEGVRLIDNKPLGGAV